jgi:hypothetical protein
MELKTNFVRKFKKWLFASVLIGLLPIILRIILFIGYVTQRNKLLFIDIGDTLLFGLVLNIGNLYEIENIEAYKKENIFEFTCSSIIMLACFVALYIVFLLDVINDYSDFALFSFSIFFNILTVIITLRHFSMEKIQNESIV